jgi:hypothetical protein
MGGTDMYDAWQIPILIGFLVVLAGIYGSRKHPFRKQHNG